MKKKGLVVACMLLICSVTVAQKPHNEVAFDKSNNSLTMVHYGYGNTVETITYTGKDQTTIRVNGNGMPTEITNSLATVYLQYAGTRSVKVTQTVNGQTKTSNVALDSQGVIDYRAEYKKFNQNPSLIDKADQFLANGGAKMIGGVVDLITEKLDNPIGACFQEALNAAKQTENPIIPISTLEALNNVANLEVNPISYLTDMVKSSIFENYKDWTQAVSDLVYKYQMDKHSKQRNSNSTEEKWRISLTNTLLANGVSMKDAADAVNKIYASQNGKPDVKSPDKGKPGVKSPDNGKTDVKSPDKGKSGVKESDKGKSESEEKGEEIIEVPDGSLDLNTIDGIINYAKMLANQKKRSMPTMINVFYHRYALWDPYSYDLTWNAEKRTYDVEDYYAKHANGAKPLGAVLEKPSVQLVLWWSNGDCDDLKSIPVAKPVDNRESKY